MSTDQGMTEEAPPEEQMPEDPEMESEVMSKTTDALVQLDQQDDEDEDSQEPVDTSGEVQSIAARVAREERMRLMPEYLNHFFLEDLPPIDPDDPFNQGIYMRYRINQMRSAQGKEPVQ